MAIETPVGGRKKQMGYPAGLLGSQDATSSYLVNDLVKGSSPTPVSAPPVPPVNLQAQADLLKSQKKLIDTQLQQAQEQLAGAKAAAPYGAASAGLAAGSRVTPTTSAGSAALQTAGAGLSGAASGALAGSVIPGLGTAAGAVIGGLVGLVSGGIQSFIGLKEARKQRREIDAQNREVRRLNEQARQDYLRETAFNQNMLTRRQGFSEKQTLLTNRQNAIQQRGQVLDQSRQLLNNLVSGNQQLKNVFIQQAR
jgi:hypothetical protein